MTVIQDPTYIQGQIDRGVGAKEAPNGAQSASSAPRALGQRSLSDKEREQRQLALAAAVPNKDQSMCECTKVLHFSVFFDGTGNNRAQERAKPVERRALSNVAKLFDAHEDALSNAYRLYVPGVGTPYPDIGDTGGTMGGAIGRGADARIERALNLLNAELDKTPAAQKLLLINVTVFGFSRGAAQARAFMRDLAALCTQGQGGAWVYRGIPLRIAFAGLFDSVCSAYESLRQAAFTTNGGHNGWAEGMRLPDMVEQTVHMVAAHEGRIRFPLDSTRIRAAYPDNTIEVWYPGVHSDVGGGYSPLYQGRQNTISRFALNHMHALGFSAGVLFKRLDAVDPELQDEFSKDDPALLEAFNAYVDAVPLKSGPMEEVQAAHMSLFYRWVKQRIEKGDALDSHQTLKAVEANAKSRKKALQKERWAKLSAAGATHADDPVLLDSERAEIKRLDGLIAQAAEDEDEADDALDDLNQESRKLVWDVSEIKRKHLRKEALTLRERTILNAWNNTTPLPSAVGRFFDLFAHDSIAHFNADSSRLSNWRTIFFDDLAYRPNDTA